MTFANGWTVSVQWGHGNYCENRDKGGFIDFERYHAGELQDFSESKSAEIAAWDADGNYHNFGRDEVKGWCSPDEVAIFVLSIAHGKGKPKAREALALEE
jgi:hypothetical protein